MDLVPRLSQTKTTTRSLPCKLTDEELLKAGADLAACTEDIHGEESRQVNIKAEMKATLAELDARRTKIAMIVRRGEEYREVRVSIVLDYQRGIVQELRDDTGELLRTREMTDSERQDKLPGTT